MHMPEIRGQFWEFSFDIDPGSVPIDQRASGKSVAHIMEPWTMAMALRDGAEAELLLYPTHASHLSITLMARRLRVLPAPCGFNASGPPASMIPPFCMGQAPGNQTNPAWGLASPVPVVID